MTEEKKEPEPKVRREYLVLGRYKTATGGVAWGIRPLQARTELPALLTESPDFRDEKVQLFTGLKGIRTGTIVSYEGSANGKTITPQTMKFVEDIPDEILAGWVIRDQSVADEVRLVNRSKDKRRLPFEALDPWRKILSRSSGDRRVMLLARILNYLERGVK